MLKILYVLKQCHPSIVCPPESSDKFIFLTAKLPSTFFGHNYLKNMNLREPYQKCLCYVYVPCIIQAVALFTSQCNQFLIKLCKRKSMRSKQKEKCSYIEDSFIEFSSQNHEVKGCGCSSQPGYG